MTSPWSGREADPGALPLEDEGASHGDAGSEALLWVGVVAGPAAWFLHLTTSYGLVGRICESGAVWPLHLVTGVTLALAVTGVLSASAGVARTGRGTRALAARSDRARFMGTGGLLLSGFFTAVIILAWIPDFVLSPCVG